MSQRVVRRTHEVTLEPVQKTFLVFFRMKDCRTALQHSLPMRLEKLEQVVMAHVVYNSNTDFVFDLDHTIQKRVGVSQHTGNGNISVPATYTNLVNCNEYAVVHDRLFTIMT